MASNAAEAGSDAMTNPWRELVPTGLTGGARRLTA